MEPADLNRRQIEAMISAGVFDALGVYRSRLLLSYEKILSIYAERGRNNVGGQLDMFAAADGTSGVAARFEYPNVPELTLREKLNMEKEAAGLYFSGHILDDYSRDITFRSPARISDVKESFDGEVTVQYKEGDFITLCGSVSKRVNKTTKNGDTMAFITLEDRSGELECVVFPKILEQYGAHLTYDSAVCVHGEISVREDEPPKLLTRKIEPLCADDKYIAKPAASPTPAPTPTPTPDNRYSAPPTPAQPNIEQRRPAAQVIPPQAAAQQNDKEVDIAAGKRLFLKVDGIDTPLFKRVYAMLEIFDGMTEVVIYNSATKKYLKASTLRVHVDEFLLGQLSAILGDGSVVLR